MSKRDKIKAKILARPTEIDFEELRDFLVSEWLDLAKGQGQPPLLLEGGHVRGVAHPDRRRAKG